ncbi:hypothetical protein CAV_0960 [Campylobacter avium LMG 24591]|uniref:Uncharacterized protein n=1 Tax=Campylobacter avium LMG 24591 TaxID=522484 RepID=A0A222MY32_9BACT|nr:hypothetical protein [Campylobacter avium]ASQ30620.1 hypothetical protein CAV_0960 [Campylobacter avium LMG 24591]OYD79716.1 hypothetical protein CAV8706_0963 [Campylobacter avium]HJE66043.1 hypothetical protein [Campylobacter avium]
MKKTSSKQELIRYIRKLEKFYNAANSMLKKDNFNQELFCEKIKKMSLFLNDFSVTLYSPYTKALQDFANDCLSMKFAQNELLMKSNAVDKLKNSQKYKKDKHKNKFKDF